MTKITRIFDLLDQYKEKYYSKKDALGFKSNNVWNTYSSEDYLNYVNNFSFGLLKLGVKKGDKIATIMLNSPEWNFIDMSLLQIGAIQVPIYPTVSEANYKFIFNDAEIKYVFISNNEIYQRIKPVLKDAPYIKDVYSIEKISGVKNWQEILTLGKNSISENLETIKSSISPNDIATIIYTSGTTGTPKGVMLSHNNFISNFLAAATIPDFDMTDRTLSFLPLCHVYERMLNYMYQYFGMSIYYAESIDNLGKNIREVKPHAFGAVPRVLEKTYDKIVRKGRGLKGIKKIIFFWALNLGHRYEINKANGWWYEFKLKIANLLVFSKWRLALGNNIKLIVSGGATLQPRLARVFCAAGIKIMEGYGLTETSPVIAVSSFLPDGYKFGTVGKNMPGVKIKIAEDGEILCKGPGVMLGYYNQPEKTAEVIDKDGWFHTGDIGMLEDGKYLKITDRKKEIFKTSGGKYIAPQVVENKYKGSPFIENIIVVGENKNFTAGLILPNFEHLESWCKIKGIEFTTNQAIIKNPKIINRIQREVDTQNTHLDKTEQIKKFVLIADEWSIESGELSPTLKLRRKFVHEKYNDVIDTIYEKT